MRIRLAVAVAPVWVWGLAISLLPHKEERFLYPVYPLVGDRPTTLAVRDNLASDPLQRLKC